MTLSLRDAALEYAERGLPVFPCNSEKKPIVPHGFKDASTEREQIIAWWGKNPNALIGMPTGEQSGVVVLDLDVKNGKNGLSAVPDWKDLSAVIAKTRSGGAHVYFQHDETIGCSSDVVARGVDTRGHGGYVILPPSPGYEWVNGSDFSQCPAYPDKYRPKRRQVEPSSTADPIAELHSVVAALSAIPNSDLGWEEWSRIGLAVWRATDGSADGFDAFDTWSKKSEKYDAGITQERWQGISASPPDKIGAGTLFFEAEKANPGWRAKITSGVTISEQISATPYMWIDAEKIPRRQWLYRPCYVRGFMAVTVASGGVGKSSLVLVEALAMATGKPLLGVKPDKALRVWYVNLEDPMEELQRRIAAICNHYTILRTEIDDQLFVNSGRTTPMLIGEEAGRSTKIHTDVVDAIANTILENRIDVLIVDPFVASHRVNENDNSSIDQVARAWATIAERTGCSVMIVHHLKKTGGAPGTVDDARGASALLAAARSARAVNTMTKPEAEHAEIDERERRRYFRADLGKANLTAPAEAADWFKMVSVDLKNCDGVDWDQGDQVGVVTPFAMPTLDVPRLTPRDVERVRQAVSNGGPWRLDVRSKVEPWVGDAVAKALAMEVGRKPIRKIIRRFVSEWIAAGHLMRVKRPDSHRQQRAYVEIGPNAPDIGPEREE